MLKDRLKLHTKWRMGIAGGQRLRWSEFTEEEKANLSEANLSRANLKNSTGNGREIKTLIASQYTVTWSGNNLAIGCEQHLIAEWWSFDDATIEKMDDGALDWWRMWKPVLRQLVEVEAV